MKIGNTKTVGELTEANVLATLIREGYSVSIPFGENTRYDYIIDDGVVMKRIQCKTGRYRNGTVRFDTNSQYRVKGKLQRFNYADTIDAFAVYCAELDKTYLVPIEDVIARRQMSLRVKTPIASSFRKNSRPHYAEKYEIKKPEISFN